MDEADDMMEDARAWAEHAETCERGHCYLPSEWGCPQCEQEDEVETVYRVKEEDVTR